MCIMDSSTTRFTVSDIKARKGKTPIVMLTAYTAPVARILDEHVDILLVGDSLGMVVYGMENTLGVTLDMMINHGAAVMRGAHKALVVVDLPYGTYEDSKEQALKAAKRVIDETGAQAVKLEGGRERAEIIKHLVDNGITVMGHVGLMPQRVKEMGYRYQGRTPEEAESILADALAVQEAGVFAMVIEATQEDVAAHITSQLTIPTIGIGASPACDGQVLVINDILGLTERPPSFVKQYANIDETIAQAAAIYASEVKQRAFPSSEFCFSGKKKQA